MTQLKDDCFAHDDRLIPMAEALEMLSGRLLPIRETETMPLADCLGRILATDIFSIVDVPAHDNSAVDGYAIRHQDLTTGNDSRLPLKGRAAAGHPMGEALAPGSTARIFTGGAMPQNADSVVMQEDVRIDGNHIIIPDGLSLGANRRKAGEDTKNGAMVLPQGQRIRPQDIGIAASTGHHELSVFRRLRVALFSSGDELVEPGNALAEGGVYDSNRHLIRGLLKNLNCEISDIGILPDNLDKVRDGIAEAAQNHSDRRPW
jgi:molybdopterin molybdotransferase